MDKSELLSQLASVTQSLCKMLSILTVAQRMSEATSDAEKEHLSRALSMLLEREQISHNPYQNSNAFGHEGYPQY